MQQPCLVTQGRCLGALWHPQQLWGQAPTSSGGKLTPSLAIDCATALYGKVLVLNELELDGHSYGFGAVGHPEFG